MSDKASRARLARAASRLGGAKGLPPLVLMTDDSRLTDPVTAASALPRASAVVVRTRSGLEPLARALLKIARQRNLVVLIANDAELAMRLGADGVHLSESRSREARHWRARFPRLTITCAAHSARALLGAQADAVFLSNVFATQSHPGRAALSPVRASLMARQARLPVYALGGIDARNAVRLSGFRGIAAIAALRP